MPRTCYLLPAFLALIVTLRLESSGTLAMTTTTHSPYEPLAALTTPFVAPSSCAHIYWRSDSKDDIITSGMLDSTNPIESCYPPRYFSSTMGALFKYYSPAVCPSGWTGSIVVDEDWYWQITRKPGETIAFCCPR